MSLSAGEIVTIETRNRPAGLVSGRELRRMLEALRTYQFSSRPARPLEKLCAVGVDYGWGELERTAGRDLLSETSAKARASLRRYLQRRLERITRPCFELEWMSFKLALNALGVSSSDAIVTERMLLRDRPWDRLSLLFQKFPVLANLWCLAIGQWRGHVLEVLHRVRKDGHALSRLFFSRFPSGSIVNLRLDLSDPHNGGRSVTLIEFSGSRRVIYKPRPGKSESAWFSFLAWMNRNGYSPKLRVARVLVRKDYHWMEYVEPAPCEKQADVRRFYERMGGLIAVAYLLKAVDCHRENVIAAGENPVLVDSDALWHVSPLTKTQSPVDVLYRTGFFPNSKRRSLQSRSSVLGKTIRGAHLARLAGKAAGAANYKEDIIKGFVQGWDCIMGTPGRRASFSKKVSRIRSHDRRWIYRATEKYAATLRASISPSLLRSEAARDAWLRRSCSRSGINKAVIQAEIKALRRLDIPYFSRRIKGWMPREKSTPPAELLEGVRHAL
jgi:lantibiotic modifying enzyme